MRLHESVVSKKGLAAFASLGSRIYKVHGLRYSYGNVVYVRGDVKISITCRVHGDFLQYVHVHIRGSGCNKCAMDGVKTTYKTFVKDAKSVHGDRFMYPDTAVEHSKSAVVITCSVHGDFKSTANNHVRSGNGGCTLCKHDQLRRTPMWSYTDWEAAGAKSKHFESFKVYVIELFNDEERFIKVGKTFTSVSKRFNFNIPYEYKVVHTVEGSSRCISELETSMHSALSGHKYIPKVSFGDMYECFSLEAKHKALELLKF